MLAHRRLPYFGMKQCITLLLFIVELSMLQFSQVPPWVRGNSVDVSPASDSPTGSPNWNDRGTADGTSVQPDSDFGKFMFMQMYD